MPNSPFNFYIFQEVDIRYFVCLAFSYIMASALLYKSQWILVAEATPTAEVEGICKILRGLEALQLVIRR